MADAFTPYWALTQPEVGSSRDTWGTKLNTDLAAIDMLLQALQPIGAMTDFAGTAAPTGWLLCDGTVYRISDYPRLFAVIGNLYGGDGVSTFGVPDAQARSTVGVGTTIGDQGAKATYGLGWRQGDVGIPITMDTLPATSITTTPALAHTHGGSVTDVRGDHAHTGQTDFGGTHGHTFVGVAFHSGGSDLAGGPDSGINFNAPTTTDGNHAHTFSTTVNGAHQHNLAISADGVHSHTFSLGSGNALRVQPLTIATTKIICCGPPSMQTAQGVMQGGTPMASPLRGMH